MRRSGNWRWPGRRAGEAVRALAWLGRDRAGAAAGVVRQRLTEDERRELGSVSTQMPGWLAGPVSAVAPWLRGTWIWPSSTAGRCSMLRPAHPAGPPICWKRTSGSCGRSRPCSRARSGRRSFSRAARRCPRPIGRLGASRRMSTLPTTFESLCRIWSEIARMRCHRTGARSGSGRRRSARLWARGHTMSPSRRSRGRCGSSSPTARS